jgi:hypothetical protein
LSGGWRRRSGGGAARVASARYGRRYREDDLLGDGGGARVRDLGHVDAKLHRGLEVDVVGADACGDHRLEVAREQEAAAVEEGRKVGLRDDVGRVGQLAVERAARALYVVGHHERVPRRLEEAAQPVLARHAADQVARRKAEGRRRRRAGAVRVCAESVAGKTVRARARQEIDPPGQCVLLRVSE